MRLLKKNLSKDGSGFCKILCEESEDLWHVYNIVAAGDRVTGVTQRKTSKEGAYGSVSTQVVTLTLTLEVTSVEYDASGDLVRISGRNCTESEHLKLGQYHTLEIRPSSSAASAAAAACSVQKERWDFLHLDQLEVATDPHKSAEVAVVLMEAGLASFRLLTSVLAKDVHRVSVGLPKKRVTTTGYDKAMIRFFEQVYAGLRDHIDLQLVKCVVLAGPGFVKDDFHTWMLNKATQSGDTLLLQKKGVFMVAHAHDCHSGGLKELLCDPQVQAKMASTKAAEHLRALELFYRTVKQEPDRVCYGPRQVQEAVDKGAVAIFMVVDSLFRNSDVRQRRRYVDLAESVRAQNAAVHVFSSQHVSGQQLAQLTGIACVLRFPLPELEDIASDAELSGGDAKGAGYEDVGLPE